MQRPVSKTLLPKIVIVAVVYYAAVRLGLETVLHAQLWTAAGIALAAVLRWGPAMLLAIVPAHLLAHLAAGSLPSFSAAAARRPRSRPSGSLLYQNAKIVRK